MYMYCVHIHICTQLNPEDVIDILSKIKKPGTRSGVQ